jgi:D-3-phosphoglycerate dehydrogenase
MKIVVLDDYQDAFRTLSCFARLAGHEVQVFHNTVKEPRLWPRACALLKQPY